MLLWRWGAEGKHTGATERFPSKSRDDCRAVALFGRADDETVAVWKFVSCARYKTYPLNSTFECDRRLDCHQVLVLAAISDSNQSGKLH